MSKRGMGLAAGVVGLVLFLAINVLANETLRAVEWDLTEEELYTLTEGSQSIAEDLDEPIRLYLFFSEDVARQFPHVMDYAERVREMLRKFADHSDGNIILEEIDPEPFSEEEERAVREGIAGIPVTPEESLYFGLVGTNPTDDREVIPFFGEIAGGISFDQKERFLEYDIARLIWTLSHPEKRKVGILSALPIAGGAPQNPLMGQEPEPRWKVLDRLEEFFDVQVLEETAPEIPGEIDALVLVHPRDLPEETLYAIDQHVMAGKPLVAFVDPHAEADLSAVDPTNPMGQFGASRASDLNRLFEAWGFEMLPNKVVGDRDSALRVRVPDQTTQRIQVIDYVVWLMLDEDNLDDEDPTTSLLQLLQMGAPGFLRPEPDATTSFDPLVWSSEEAMEIDVGRLQFMPDPRGLLESYVPGKQRLTLAARISGESASAFADGPPGDEPGDEPEDEPGEEPEGTDDEQGPDGAQAENVEADEAPEQDPDGDDAVEGGSDAHLAASQGPIQVIAVADVDMLQDRWWITESTLLGMSVGWRQTSDNADFLINAIENLLGGQELASIRARGRFSRPFDRVEEIRREAERRYLSEQVELERRLQEAQRRINELQREKGVDESLILSPEQEAELARAEEDLLETKRKLREVQHRLRADIEALGTTWKWINIAAIPALVAIAAVALGAWRVRRRNR